MIKDEKQAYSITYIYRFRTLLPILAWVLAIALIYSENKYFGVTSDIPYLLIPIITGIATLLFWDNITIILG